MEGSDDETTTNEETATDETKDETEPMTAAEAKAKQEAAKKAEMEASIQKHGEKGRELYQETPWPCVLLWKLAKFRPGGVTDKEWTAMSSRRLMPRDLFMMYGVLSLWNELPHYEDEYFGRMHAIYSLLTCNMQAFAKVLRQAPETLGIKPINRLNLKFNKTLLAAWDSYEEDEIVRGQSHEWDEKNAAESASASADAGASESDSV